MDLNKTLKLFLVTASLTFLASSCTSKVDNTNKYFDENIDNTTFCSIEGWNKLSSGDEIYKNVIGSKENNVSKMVSVSFHATSFHSRSSEITYGSGEENYYLYTDGLKTECDSVTKYVNQDGSTYETLKYHSYSESVNGGDRYYSKRYNSSVKPELNWAIGSIKNHSEEVYDELFFLNETSELYYSFDELGNTVVSKTDVYRSYVSGGENVITTQTIFVFDKNYLLKERYYYSEQNYSDKWGIVINRSLICATIKHGTVKGFPNKAKFINSVPNEYVFSTEHCYDVYNVIDGSVNYGSYSRNSFFVESDRNYNKGIIFAVLQQEIVAEKNSIAVSICVEKRYELLKDSLTNYYKTKTQFVTNKVAKLYKYETIDYEGRDDVLIIIPEGETFNINVIAESSLYDSSVTNVRKN